MELIPNLRRLPQELVLKIWSYTYSQQSPELLADIRDYLTSLDFIHCYYYDRYMEMGYTEYKYWLVNNIFGYIVFFSYEEDRSFYNEFWRRSFQCRQIPLENLSDYIYRLENNKIETQIRLLWALLYPEERAEFIDSVEYFIINDEEEDDFDP